MGAVDFYTVVAGCLNAAGSSGILPDEVFDFFLRQRPGFSATAGDIARRKEFIAYRVFIRPGAGMVHLGDDDELRPDGVDRRNEVALGQQDVVAGQGDLLVVYLARRIYIGVFRNDRTDEGVLGNGRIVIDEVGTDVALS